MQIQESIEVNSEIGTGMEWLFKQEEPSNSLNQEQIKEVAAEIENEEFEPLEPFEENERNSFSPFKHRESNKPFYGAIGMCSGTLSGLYTAFALKQGAVIPTNAPDLTWYDPLIGWSMMMGGLAAGIKAGERFADYVEELDPNKNDFNSVELGNSYNQDIYGLIECSDIVVDIEADDDLDLLDKSYPEPVEAAEAYRSTIDILEDRKSFWKNQVELNNFEPIREEVEAILETYEDDEIRESRLSEAIKHEEEIKKHHQEKLERDLEALEESEISTFVKYSHFQTEISGENTETFSYDGFAYEIEIYQGEDQVLTIDGVNSEKPISQVTS